MCVYIRVTRTQPYTQYVQQHTPSPLQSPLTVIIIADINNMMLWRVLLFSLVILQCLCNGAQTFPVIVRERPRAVVVVVRGGVARVWQSRQPEYLGHTHTHAHKYTIQGQTDWRTICSRQISVSKKRNHSHTKCTDMQTYMNKNAWSHAETQFTDQGRPILFRLYHETYTGCREAVRQGVWKGWMEKNDFTVCRERGVKKLDVRKKQR